MNVMWMFLILVMLIFSILISKHIKLKNFKLLKILRVFNNKNKTGLFLTLGTKIGVGSIIGTTISIYIGGPGSVFWIIFFSLVTSSLIYYESYIGSKYKQKVNNSYLSGPYFYIKNGVKSNRLAILTMIILIMCYSLLFQMIQTNTITHILQINFKINSVIIAVTLTIIILFLIFFSLKDLINSMNKIVPLMCIIYVCLGAFIIIKNIGQLSNIINLIIDSAFTKRGLLIGLVIGVKRAIFLNEIMIGTTSIGSGIDESSPSESACIQTLGMYFITLVISLITSILILLFKQNNIFFISNYNELISQVFIFHFGSIGSYILAIIIFLFALTTIISGYYIGVSNLLIINKNKKLIFIFKIFVLLFCIGGIFISNDQIWKYIDILMYILIIINIYSLYIIYKGEKYDRK